MAQKRFKNQEERSAIRDKIENYNKYQWLVFIPLWLVTIAQMIFPARAIPLPETSILFVDVAVFLFSVIAFLVIRLRIRKYKAALEHLDKP